LRYLGRDPFRTPDHCHIDRHDPPQLRAGAGACPAATRYRAGQVRVWTVAAGRRRPVSVAGRRGRAAHRTAPRGAVSAAATPRQHHKPVAVPVRSPAVWASTMTCSMTASGSASDPSYVRRYIPASQSDPQHNFCHDLAHWAPACRPLVFKTAA
jgi:hypothetical protein